jgi:hypothetical protein
MTDVTAHLAQLLQNFCLPPSNIVLESKVLTLRTVFHTSRYEVYLCYLFDDDDVFYCSFRN